MTENVATQDTQSPQIIPPPEMPGVVPVTQKRIWIPNILNNYLRVDSKGQNPFQVKTAQALVIAILEDFYSKEENKQRALKKMGVLGESSSIEG